MTLILVFVLGTVFALTITFRPTNLPAASEENQTVIEDAEMAEDENPSRLEVNWDEFQTRWAGAPEDIRSIARTIVEGGVPGAEVLTALGKDGVSRGYRVPEWSFTMDDRLVTYTATLLKQAVLSINPEAVHALLEAGADPTGYHNQALFSAIAERTPGSPPLMLFKDHDALLPILRALLDAGAETNLRRFGFRETPFEYASKINNLGAMIMLLEYGADPWLQREHRPNAQGSTFVEESAIQAIIGQTGGKTGIEKAFRVLRTGRVPRGTEDEVQRLTQELSAAVGRISEGSGPTARHAAWRMDQLLTVYGTSFDAVSEMELLRVKLPAFDWSEDGGWFLAEDEIHSRYDAPLQVPDKGTQIWGP